MWDLTFFRQQVALKEVWLHNLWTLCHLSTIVELDLILLHPTQNVFEGVELSRRRSNFGTRVSCYSSPFFIAVCDVSGR